ncbi:PTS transporter subunit EIIB [Liquorilactobacillus capillatus]|uniref:PTS EIIB type-1 domain-containing protein n=1 Tax=Liquorilactobacillus capillatus DSM 19910 TaxID=1423731 RepID=A0A0R1M781_9LACO|nr:PTS transporter subunit EIIB [Liquorilactobacillus capillatus]KRL01492.1 hypothetical protein FC81_GL001175 [Liquorilactobacillus capillatus DSM 19910]
MTSEKTLGKKILALVGGENNIQGISRCATRLRMLLKNEQIASNNKSAIEDLNGVISVVENGGQFQVIIGPAVANVYDELLEGTSLGKENTEENTHEKNQHGLISNFLDIVAGIFTPLLPLLAGSGVLRGIVLLLT